MRIVFHLGTYKTGSTSFQNTCFENCEYLESAGVLYPKSGLKKDAKLGYRHTPLILDFYSGKSTFCPSSLLEELTNSKADLAILSSEAWSKAEHLSHLVRLTSFLQSHGFKDLIGILALRNLADYQVSHYREFTINQKNARRYPLYVRNHINSFDYLLLARAFRSIFGKNLIAIPFRHEIDIVRDLFKKIGIGELYNGMSIPRRSNIKSETAIEVEAIRCANKLKLTPDTGIFVLNNLLSKRPELSSTPWTEAFQGHVPEFSSMYKAMLAAELGWDEQETSMLFTSKPIGPQNVSLVTDAITARLRRQA